MKKSVSIKNILRSPQMPVKTIKTNQKLLISSNENVQTPNNNQSVRNEIENLNKDLKQQTKQRQFQIKQLYKMITQLQKSQKLKCKHNIPLMQRKNKSIELLHLPLTHTLNQNQGQNQNQTNICQKRKTNQSYINIKNSTMKFSKNNTITTEDIQQIETIKKEKRKLRCGTITSHKQLPMPNSPFNSNSRFQIQNEEQFSKDLQTYLQTTASQFFKSTLYESSQNWKNNTSLGSPKTIVSPTKSFKSDKLQLSKSNGKNLFTTHTTNQSRQKHLQISNLRLQSQILQKRLWNQNMQKMNLRILFLENKLKSFEALQKYIEQKVQDCIIKNHHLAACTDKIIHNQQHIMQKNNVIQSNVGKNTSNINQITIKFDEIKLNIDQIRSNSRQLAQRINQARQTINQMSSISNHITQTINNTSRTTNSFIETAHHLKQIVNNQNSKIQNIQKQFNHFKRISKINVEDITNNAKTQIQDFINNQKQQIQCFMTNLYKKMFQLPIQQEHKQVVQSLIVDKIRNYIGQNIQQLSSIDNRVTQCEIQLKQLKQNNKMLNSEEQSMIEQQNYNQKLQILTKIQQIQTRIDGTQQVVSQLMKVSLTLTQKVNSITSKVSQKPNNKEINHNRFQKKGQIKIKGDFSQQYWLLKQQLRTIDQHSRESSIQIMNQSLIQNLKNLDQSSIVQKDQSQIILKVNNLNGSVILNEVYTEQISNLKQTY